MPVDINKFYNAKSWRQPHALRCKVKGYSDAFDIDLVGNDQKPDCSIGHFGYNLYFRTGKGCNFGKYKNLKTMFKDIKLKAKTIGLLIESFGIARGYKYKALLT